MRIDEEIDHAISVVLASPTATFTTLVRISGLDPARSFRFAPLQGVDFSRQDLRDFDFRGADLTGCRFQDTRIFGANFDSARVDPLSLKEALDWKAYNERQQSRKTKSGRSHPAEVTEQLSYEKALAAFRALLKTKKALRPETISTMVEISPGFASAANIINMSLDGEQKLPANALRGLAKKLPQQVINGWLVRIINTNNNSADRTKGELKIFLAVEMSNLLEHLGDPSPATAFNRMLSETREIGELLALISYYADRAWPISVSTMDGIEKRLLEFGYLREPPLPGRGQRATEFSRVPKSAYEYYDYN